jgi:DNA invertase Pin-like site-specific DNA recombinase
MEQGMTSQIKSAQALPVDKIKYCLYARKSTETEERQILSIDSQIKEMLQIAEKDGLEVVEIRRESHSAKNSSERPVFNSIIDDIRAGKFNGVMAWAPDRLSRNAGDLGTLVDLMDQKLLIEIRTYGQRFINSPNEKFLLMILCSQAKLENDNKSINVRRGLRARVEMGLWPTTAPTGYLNQKMMDKKCQVLVDPERGPVIKKMFEKMAYEKFSGRKIYHWLRFELNFRTQYNHHLSLSNIYLLLQNHFYYGTFEYPRGSGNWYIGKHEPIISKELFEQVQEQLKRTEITRETREFAFTKLLVCGLCGSGITAQEKYKKLKDGTMARYVYYACTRSRDLHCKNEYIREEELINKLLEMIDKIDMNELGLKVRLEDEVARYSKFQNMMGMINNAKVKTKTLNTRTFVKYILKEGSIIEKRELLANMKSRLVITNKELTLQE